VYAYNRHGLDEKARNSDGVTFLQFLYISCEMATFQTGPGFIEKKIHSNIMEIFQNPAEA
jgi:hypothetical protein